MEKTKLFTPPVPAPEYGRSLLSGIGAGLGLWGVVFLAVLVWLLTHFGGGQ